MCVCVCVCVCVFTSNNVDPFGKNLGMEYMTFKKKGFKVKERVN